MKDRKLVSNITQLHDFQSIRSIKTNPIVDPWILGIRLIADGNMRKENETVIFLQMIGLFTQLISSLAWYNDMQDKVVNYLLRRIMSMQSFMVTAVQNRDGFLCGWIGTEITDFFNCHKNSFQTKSQRSCYADFCLIIEQQNMK